MALVLENCIYLFIYFKRGAKIFLIPKFYLSIGNQFYVCFFFFFSVRCGVQSLSSFPLLSLIHAPHFSRPNCLIQIIICNNFVSG